MGKNVLKGKIFNIKVLSKGMGFNGGKIGLEESVDEYNLPDKLYGDIEKYSTILWNDFAKPNGRASALLVGKAGTGKTIFCKNVANIAIKRGINVYTLEGKNSSSEIIDFIASLNNCVIFIDEFGKQFSNYEQDKLLSLLTDTEKKRMFLFTENYMDNINDFILNRPGRVKYNFDFDTLENSIIAEYCEDNNVPNELRDSLIELNNTKIQFCFDHLVNICSLSKELNIIDMEEILKILNVPCLRGDITMTPISIKHIETGEKYDLYRRPVFTKGIIVAELATNDSCKLFNNDNNNNNNEDKEKKKEKSFLERFEKDYLNVDINTCPEVGDDRWDTKRRARGEYKRFGSWVKISLTLDNKIGKGNTDEIIYKDVTGKYEVTFKR